MQSVVEGGVKLLCVGISAPERGTVLGDRKYQRLSGNVQSLGRGTTVSAS